MVMAPIYWPGRALGWTVVHPDTESCVSFLLLEEMCTENVIPQAVMSPGNTRPLIHNPNVRTNGLLADIKPLLYGQLATVRSAVGLTYKPRLLVVRRDPNWRTDGGATSLMITTTH